MVNGAILALLLGPGIGLNFGWCPDEILPVLEAVLQRLANARPARRPLSGVLGAEQPDGGRRGTTGTTGDEAHRHPPPHRLRATVVSPPAPRSAVNLLHPLLSYNQLYELEGVNSTLCSSH